VIALRNKLTDTEKINALNTLLKVIERDLPYKYTTSSVRCLESFNILKTSKERSNKYSDFLIYKNRVGELEN